MSGQKMLVKALADEDVDLKQKALTKIKQEAVIMIVCSVVLLAIIAIIIF